LVYLSGELGKLFNSHSIEAWTVVGYAGDAYGLHVFLELLRSLPEADSMDSWLRTALDADLETFEAGWRAWLKELVAR